MDNSKEDWLPVVLDYIFIKGDKIENIFAHAKKQSENHFLIMVPSHNYFSSFISTDKIKVYL